MLYVHKNKEPRCVLDWKNKSCPEWFPEWNNMPGEVKSALLDALLFDQGYICCYCGMRIGPENSHVEHVRPRNGYKSIELDYENLLASCGRRQCPKQPIHCGAAKKDWYDEELFVSPLEENCSEQFQYAADGVIYPINDNIPSKTTIKKLNLNSGNLKEHRKKAVEAAILLLSEHTIEEIINRMGLRNTDNRLEAFCFVICSVLSGLQ